MQDELTELLHKFDVFSNWNWNGMEYIVNLQLQHIDRTLFGGVKWHFISFSRYSDMTDHKEGYCKTPSVWPDRSCSTIDLRHRCPGFDRSCWHPRRLPRETSYLGRWYVCAETVTPRPGILCRLLSPTCDRGTAVRPVMGCSLHHLWCIIIPSIL